MMKSLRLSQVTIIALKLFHTPSHTPAADDLNINFDGVDWIASAKKSQTLADFDCFSTYMESIRRAR